MPNHRQRPTAVAKAAPRGAGIGQILRLFWMLLGPGLVGYAAAYVVIERPGLPSLADLLYWGGVAALLAARWLDIVRYGGATADGEPATSSHWRRYAVVLGVIAVALWAAAHAAAAALGD